jgi:hypothetical protein
MRRLCASISSCLILHSWNGAGNLGPPSPLVEEEVRKQLMTGIDGIGVEIA